MLEPANRGLGGQAQFTEGQLPTRIEVLVEILEHRTRLPYGVI
jgi:hypothetical protein